MTKQAKRLEKELVSVGKVFIKRISTLDEDVLVVGRGGDLWDDLD